MHLGQETICFDYYIAKFWKKNWINLLKLGKWKICDLLIHRDESITVEDRGK